MVQAIWKDTVLASSDKTIVVEGNHYFPPDDVNFDFFRESATETFCGWKGTASYYHVVVDSEINTDAAWYYSDPKEEAKNIIGYVAFWKGVKVKEGGE
jgi:uncharacterized protein (DUF427 family)